MITFDIDDIKATQSTLSEVEETLDKKAREIEQLIETYKSEVEIEPEWSFDARDTNNITLNKGVEYYEDIYGEIKNTRDRVANFKQALTHFLADISGLDEETTKRMGFLSPEGADFSLSELEIGGKDNAIAFRRDGGSSLETGQVPGNNKPIVQVPITPATEEEKRGGNIKSEQSQQATPRLYQDVNVEELLKDERIRNEIYDENGNIRPEIIEAGGAGFSLEEAVINAQKRVQDQDV